MTENGILYLIATPIGNMEDITYRAVRILGEADVLVCEDTRQTAKIYNHYGIEKPEIRFPCHEYNEKKVETKIISLLREGKSVAFCSDAGYPGISDPGYRVISRAVSEDIPIQVIPGASAVPAALLMSGLPTSSYLFKGFPPRKKGQRNKFLTMEADKPHTLIFYESPYRIMAFLRDAREALGNRRAAVCFELTKKFERVQRGYLEDIAGELENRSIKGEIVVVIAGNNPKFIS